MQIEEAMGREGDGVESVDLDGREMQKVNGNEVQVLNSRISLNSDDTFFIQHPQT